MSAVDRMKSGWKKSRGYLAFALLAAIMTPIMSAGMSNAKPATVQLGQYAFTNVQMSYSHNASDNAFNGTRVYIGQVEWQASLDDGLIATVNKGVRLVLPHHVKLIAATATYGDINSPTYQSVDWNGRGTLPSSKKLMALDGAWHDIPLNYVSVSAWSSRHPHQPPAVAGK